VSADNDQIDIEILDCLWKNCGRVSRTYHYIRTEICRWPIRAVEIRCQPFEIMTGVFAGSLNHSSIARQFEWCWVNTMDEVQLRFIPASNSYRIL
jgi:hypothetical protein